ncbi:MAG: carbon-nitrogen hydrolase family protein [Promethearchaeota archaeon]
MKIGVSLVQFDRDHMNKAKNVEHMLSILSRIENTDITCLPEIWTGGILETNEYESLLLSLSEIANKNNYNLLTGGLFNRRENKIFDTSHLINRTGKIIGFSDKRFPSAATGEREFVYPGKESPIFTVDGVKIGVVICVDAIYPEIARHLALKGADIIFNPSDIPDNRNDLWKYISVARAAENTVFYVYVNNTNTYYPDGRKVTGHSVVVTPDGELILEAEEEEGVFQITLDLDQIDFVRKRWRYINDIRPLWKPLNRVFQQPFLDLNSTKNTGVKLD